MAAPSLDSRCKRPAACRCSFTPHLTATPTPGILSDTPVLALRSAPFLTGTSSPINLRPAHAAASVTPASQAARDRPRAAERLNAIRMTKLEPQRECIRRHLHHDTDFLYLPAVLALLDDAPLQVHCECVSCGTCASVPSSLLLLAARSPATAAITHHVLQLP